MGMDCADAMLADFTVKKIREFSQGDKPFFLEHCFAKVHADNFANREYEGKIASEYQNDGIVEVELLIGKFVNALDDNGFLEKTIVFVTSDNGPLMDAWTKTGHTPFRGAKGTTEEGGVRVPGII